MINNITTATTSKISITILSCTTTGELKAKLGGLILNRLKRDGSGNTNLILASLGNIVDVEEVYIAIITCVCNLINETYPCKRDIAIGRMINNITTATTSKISITILSCINNMISCTSTIEDNIASISPYTLHNIESTNACK
jgi:hypothetical protein